MQTFFDKYKIEDNVLAVGVSGGSDSLALVLRLDEFLRPLGKKIIALTVDHQLRPESADEAAYVHCLMQKYDIEHHTLVWEGRKPKTGIEEAARKARYQLLRDWCLTHNVHCLCVAHHKLDQAETFLMRLQRGSGLNGLCGMQAVSELYGLKIVRPFLNENPDDLKAYLKSKHIKWVTDNSNNCDDFLRVRIRKFLPLLEIETGITVQRLVDTMAVLQRSRDYIEKQTHKFIKNHVRFWDGVGASVLLSVLGQQHEEIVYRVLTDLIKKIGQNDYTPRAEDIERLSCCLREKFEGIEFSTVKLDGLVELKNNMACCDFKGATLGHCEIFIAQSKLWIAPELKLKTKMPKKVWENYLTLYPEYARLKLPYKLRVALVKSKMNVEF